MKSFTFSVFYTQECVSLYVVYCFFNNQCHKRVLNQKHKMLFMAARKKVNALHLVSEP